MRGHLPVHCAHCLVGRVAQQEAIAMGFLAIIALLILAGPTWVWRYITSFFWGAPSPQRQRRRRR